MLALWLSAGLIAKQSSARGDDAGGLAYGSGQAERMLRERAMEQFASRLEEVERKAKRAKRDPEAINEAVEALDNVRLVAITPDLIARVDAISATLERMASERAAMGTALAQLAAQIEAAQRLAEQKRQRRRREEDIILQFIAGLQ